MRIIVPCILASLFFLYVLIVLFYGADTVSIVPGRTRSYSDAPNDEYEGHESRRNTHLY